MSEILVFYDGQCDLCKNSISWVEQRLRIQALDYHVTELEKFNLTLEQCSREVMVIYRDQQFAGADAAAFLLERRGNTKLAKVIRSFRPLSRFTYRWIADHRRAIPVQFLSYLLRR